MNLILGNAILSGISYLQTQQQNDGSFLSLSSQSSTNFKNAITLRSTFSTALILSCLNYLKETPTLHKIKEKAASFLLSQKSKNWSFNYWVRGSKEAKAMPYPDDLDDTFCALSALYQHNPQLVEGTAMAKIVTLLTAVEDKEGGPYRTWIVPKKAPKIWKDVDLAVNSNIAYFLSLQEVELPNLIFLIESSINRRNLTSSYYPTIYPIIYFISRWYKGKGVTKIKNILFSKQNKDGYWENPLHTALAVSSLLHLGVSPIDLRKSFDYLLSRQAKGGSWKPYGFCLDPAREGKAYYSGSRALTTAFCLETISKCMTFKTQSNEITNKIDSKSEQVHSDVIRQVRARFSHLNSELKDQGKMMLATILKMNDKNQITLLPYFFKSSLGKNGTLISNKLLISLGLANTYGWIAYTIYDNFLDEEGDPKTLSIANVALRALTIIFHEILPENTGFQKLFHRIMDELDEANAWEVTNCRVRIEDGRIDPENISIPEFGHCERLAQKSLGHALGPLAILFSLGYKERSLEVKNLLNFFKHYLIARQLNDDAHDWEKDLRNGQISPVCAMLLQVYKIKKSNTKILVPALIAELKELFWYEVIVTICQLILKHVSLAHKSLNNLSIMENQVLFQKLLDSVEQSAKQALSEREKVLEFSKSYKPSS